jgi:hypothetical protein
METGKETENRKGKLHTTVVIEWVTILTAVLGCFGILYAEIKGLDGKIERQGERIDRQGERTDRIIEISNSRADKLYEMFIDLLKETKCSKVEDSKKTP